MVDTISRHPTRQGRQLRKGGSGRGQSFTLKYVMKARRFVLAIAAAALSLSVSAQQSTTKPAVLPDSPQPTGPAAVPPNGPMVVMDTSMGRITCQFFQKQAPVAVANFIGLATGKKDWTDPATKKVMHGKPYYNHTTFHRVIAQFMIQGGDPTGTGSGDPGFSFNDEFNPNLNFDVAGRLAMANSGPNTNGSQFFITELPYPSLSQHYTVFGQCDEPSVNVVKTIARVRTDSNDKPIAPVYLNKVTIVPEGQQLPPSTPDSLKPPTAGPGSAPISPQL